MSDFGTNIGGSPGAGPGAQAPKLIIDDDWKNQAQAEKERLAESEVTAPKSGVGAAGAAGGAMPAEGELPPADFQSLAGMLMSQALIYLGGVADRQTGRAIFDPEMSKFYIDLLGVLEAKTKGNLTPDEAKDLTQGLSELRMRFVELMKMVARQAAEGRAAGGPGALGGSGMSGPGMSGPGMTGGGGFGGAGPLRAM